MNPILLLVGILAYAATGSPATSDQLRQWILANRNSIPAGAEQAIAAANTDGDLASTILRIFGLGRQVTPEPVEKSTGSNGIKIGERDVCPFDADPLILAGEYKSCNPSSIGDCPVGFLCDQSFALGRSICCQDLRNRPNGVQTTMQTPFNWNNLGRTTVPGFRRWTPLTQQPRRGNPWYIKDRTSWNNIYNRVTPLEPVESTESSTITPSTTVSTTTEVSMTTASSIVNPWARLWSTTTTAPSIAGVPSPNQQQSVNVTVLQAGSVRALSEELYESIASITLVTDGAVRMLVDTGASSETERLLQSLAKEGVTLEDIDMVVITHGHPGHMGNMNFFGQKTVLFHSMQYVGRSVSPTELRDRPYRKLSTNVELWKTPGHTQQDLSLLVHNVPGYGSMAIVGDLIPSEEMIEHYKSNMPPQEGVWDVATQRQNANLMVCMSDWIVPGHGQPFRVKTEYRQKAGCTRLLAQMRLKAQ